MLRKLRLPLVSALLVCGFAISGCVGTPANEVTFYAGGTSTRVAPSQYCDVRGENCTGDEHAQGKLELPPGKPLQVSVPQSMATAPWQVVFAYRDAATGRVEQGRSVVFPPTERFAYTLRLPHPEDQLTEVQVQQYAAVLVAGEDGGVQFPLRGSWVLAAA